MFKQHGLTCATKRAARLRDIRKAIDAGCPVLVTLHSGTHYAVIYGYSPSHIYVVDPSVLVNVWCRLLKEDFKAQWDKWCMVVLNAVRISPCAPAEEHFRSGKSRV